MGSLLPKPNLLIGVLEHKPRGELLKHLNAVNPLPRSGYPFVPQRHMGVSLGLHGLLGCAEGVE